MHRLADAIVTAPLPPDARGARIRRCLAPLLAPDVPQDLRRETMQRVFDALRDLPHGEGRRFFTRDEAIALGALFFIAEREARLPYDDLIERAGELCDALVTQLDALPPPPAPSRPAPHDPGRSPCR